MKLSIKSTHIDESIRSAANHCMIAAAIKEKIPTARWVLVDLQSIRWTDRKAGRRFIFRTPLMAQKALLDFDKGMSVRPFEFTLPAPESKPIQKRPARKPKTDLQSRRRAKSKKIYKKAKTAPEHTTERRHGIRLFA